MSQVSRKAHVLPVAAFACAALLPVAGWAELSKESLVGAGLRSRPAYDGSASQRQELVPVIRYFGQPWFLRSTQGVLEAGVRRSPPRAARRRASRVRAGAPGRRVVVPGQPQRAKPQARRLDRPARGVGPKLGPVPVTLLARARRNVDSGLGSQVDLRLSAGVFQRGRVSAGVFAQAVWAIARSNAAYYGVAAQQAATTGLRAYQPRSGWLNASAGLLWSLDLSGHWVVVSVERRRLRGDAADSPLVERLSNTCVSAGVAYRF